MFGRPAVFYDSAMRRLVPVVSMALVALGCGGRRRGYAGPEAPCTYTLSPPEERQRGHLHRGDRGLRRGCRPIRVSRVIQPLEPNSVITCAQGRGADPAVVSVPFHPGVRMWRPAGCAAWALQPKARRPARSSAPDRRPVAVAVDRAALVAGGIRLASGFHSLSTRCARTGSG